MRAYWWAPALLVVALVVAVGYARLPALLGPPPDLQFTIPYGTGAALAAGQSAFELPDHLLLRTGQSVSVFNADDTIHFVFDAPIPPRKTYRRTFAQPGTFKLSQLGCTIFADLQRQIVVDVRDS